MKTLTSSDRLLLVLRIGAMLLIGALIGVLPCVNVISGVLAALVWILWEGTPRSKALLKGTFAGLLAGIGGVIFYSVTGIGYPASVMTNVFIALLMGGITGYLVGRRRPQITDVEVWKDQRRTDLLIQALSYRGSDRDRPAWQIRMEAAAALGDVGDARAVEPLVEALSDVDNRVRETVVEALDALEWRPAENAVGASYWILKMRWEECVRIGPPAVPPLLEALKYQDPQVCRGAVRALAAIGDKRATVPLVQMLRDGSQQVRQSVALALIKIGDPKAIAPLIALLDNHDPSLRQASVEILGQIGDERAVKSLANMLTDHTYIGMDTEMVVDAMVKIGGEQARTSLVALLSSSSWTVREAVSQSLIQVGMPAVHALVSGLTDENSDVRRAAGRILIAILDSDSEELGTSGDAISAEIDRSLLINVLADPDPEVRQAAVGLLTCLGWQPVEIDERVRYYVAAQQWGAVEDIGAAAVDPLTAELEDSDWKTRRAVVEVLGNIGDPLALDALSNAITDRSLRVRQAAAGALGRIGNEKAVKLLIGALEDEEDRVRDTARAALIQCGSIGFDMLVQALRSRHAYVRESVAYVLDHHGWHPDNLKHKADYLVAQQSWDACIALDTDAINALIGVLDDQDPDVRERAAQALGEIGDIRAVEPLVVALKDRERNDKWVRMRIARALQNIGGKRVMDAMLEVLDEDRDIFTVTSSILSHEPRAVPSLIGYLKDKNPVVREYAAIALGHIGDTRAIESLRVALQDDRRDDRGSAREAASQALQRLQEGQGKSERREADLEETQEEAIERASQWEQSVSLVRVDKRKVMTGNAQGAFEIERVYRVHQGPSRDAALSFLADHPVMRMHEYVIVETPEGNYGRDISGIFDEESGEAVAPELLKPFAYGTLVIVVPPDLNRGFYLDAIVQAVCLDDHQEYEATFRNIAPDGKSIAAIFPKLPAGKTYRLQLPVPMPGFTPEAGPVSVKVKPAQVVELKPFG
jgi:HEAT repeat protein